MKKRLHLTLILQLKNLFKERNIPYPLIYNSYDLLLLLDKLHITNNIVRLVSHNFLLQIPLHQHITPWHYSSHHNALQTAFKICQTFILYRDYLLNLNKNLTLLLLVIPPISYLGVAMDSYHSRQIVELVLSLSIFSLFNNTNCPTK